MMVFGGNSVTFSRLTEIALSLLRKVNGRRNSFGCVTFG
jgi:hypothetical protein